jgi:3-deoxy-D-manno-octulosonic-acid transferase
MIQSFLYEMSLIFIALISLPKLLIQIGLRGKYRQSFSHRLGMGFPSIIKESTNKIIWIHSVSVGEVKAVASLVKKMKITHPNALFVISSITETGHFEAKKNISEANYHVYLPLDFYFIIAPIVKRVSPDLVILCETDFWLNFIKAAKQCGAKVALVNGKISERSLQRFRKFPKFSNTLFSFFDLFCIQNTTFQNRFLELGIPSSKMHVTGNMKFDDLYRKMDQDETVAWKKEIGIDSDNLVVVFGSTHDPEESLFLGIVQKIWQKYPHLKIIIVPRHPERFNQVAALLTRLELPFIRYSQPQVKPKAANVILIDAMGVIRKCYQIANIAVVAGSFTEKVGGHNILEPSYYGVPVIFGPHMHQQPELKTLSIEYGAGIQVKENELYPALESLLSTPEKASQMGVAGLRLTSEMTGATDRTLKCLQKLL